MPPLAIVVPDLSCFVFHSHSYPTFVTVGVGPLEFEDQLAVNWTVPSVLLKFLKYLLVTLDPFHDNVVVESFPYFAVVSKPLAVVDDQPVNDWVIVVEALIVAPVPFAFPVIVTTFVGFSTVTNSSYVPLFGFWLWLPLFNP